MFQLWKRFVDWLRRMFLRKNMEFCVVGLSGAGKTSFVNLLASGEFKDQVIPTVGFNMRKIKRGGIVMKVWDLGGQRRFRGMWERYCRGVEVMCYMVDASERGKFPEASAELQHLLARPSCQGIPVLIIGNKIDLKDAVKQNDLESALHLKQHAESRKMGLLMMSCKTKARFYDVLDWLIQNTNQN